MNSTIPEFSCKDKCQAPDAFWSGAPMKISPEYENAMLQFGDQVSITWSQLKTTEMSTQITINGHIMTGNQGSLQDLQYTLKETTSSPTSKLFQLELEHSVSVPHISVNVWSVKVSNDAGVIEQLFSLKMDAKLSEWSDWSKCDQTCTKFDQDIPTQTRKRSCMAEAINSDVTCSSLKDLTESQNCQIKPCPGSFAHWSQWSSWSKCSVSCGSGIKKRHQFYVDPTSTKDPRTERKECVLEPCPCIPQAWQEWSTCSPCGRHGKKQRLRPGNGHCNKSSLLEEEPCFLKPCTNEYFTLDSIYAFTKDEYEAGSDTSVWIELENGQQKCSTAVLDE